MYTQPPLVLTSPSSASTPAPAAAPRRSGRGSSLQQDHPSCSLQRNVNISLFRSQETVKSQCYTTYRPERNSSAHLCLAHTTHQLRTAQMDNPGLPHYFAT